MAIQSYQDLQVWQKGMRLAVDVYSVTRKFPREELFGMIQQLRRSAASVPANIAEGYGRENRGDHVQFLRIAQGSLKELETHLLLSVEVGLCCPDNVRPLIAKSEEIGRMLHSLIRRLQEAGKKTVGVKR